MINVCEVLHVVITGEEVHVEYPPFDGWFNNLAHPDWGGAGMPMPLLHNQSHIFQ